MRRLISKSQFKPRALEYFRHVQRTGQPLVITDHGKPVLKIVRLDDDPSALLASLRHSVVKYLAPTEPVSQEDWESLR